MRGCPTAALLVRVARTGDVEVMMKLLSQLVVLLIVAMVVVTDAQAESNVVRESFGELLRSGTKASSAEVGLGTLVAMSASGTAFDLHLNYSHHFSGDASGLALGADLDIFASGVKGAIIVPGVRGVYDHEVAEAVYLSPFVGVGVALGTKGSVGFNTRLGFAVKVLLNDLFLVSVQPVGVDLSIGTEGVIVSYNLLFGGGIIF
jgi:hypothetical protein